MQRRAGPVPAAAQAARSQVTKIKSKAGLLPVPAAAQAARSKATEIRSKAGPAPGPAAAQAARRGCRSPARTACAS